MPLSPLDISRHEFSKSLRGYDPAEVQAYLERVAEELAFVQTQLTQLTEEHRASVAKLTAYQNLESSLRDSLAATQEQQRRLHEQLEIQRQQTLNEARLEAEQIRLSAHREVMAIKEEVRALKMHHEAYIKRLRFLLKAQTELIDLLEQESPELPSHDESQAATE